MIMWRREEVCCTMTLEKDYRNIGPKEKSCQRVSQPTGEALCWLSPCPGEWKAPALMLPVRALRRMPGKKTYCLVFDG